MVNWKKAGVVLVSLGVTATVGYISYSLIFKANKKMLKQFLEDEKTSKILGSELSDETILNMNKKIHNLSKKQLARLDELARRNELTEAEKLEVEKLKNIWGYEKG